LSIYLDEGSFLSILSTIKCNFCGIMEKKRISKDGLKRALRIFKYVLPYRLKFGLGLVFLLLSSLTFMSFPGLIGRLVGGDEVSDSAIDQFFNLQNIDQVA
jgi:hypothetical protein